MKRKRKIEVKIHTCRVEGKELSSEKPKVWGSDGECVGVKSSMYVICEKTFKKKLGEDYVRKRVGMRGREERRVVGYEMNTLEAVLGNKKRYSCHHFYTCQVPRHRCALLETRYRVRYLLEHPKYLLSFYLSKSYFTILITWRCTLTVTHRFNRNRRFSHFSFHFLSLFFFAAFFLKK